MKLKVIFLTILMFISTESLAADRLLPLPKPLIDKKTKKTLLDKKHIYPVKKPTPKEKKIEPNEDQQLTEITTNNEIEVFIYPQEKPVVVKKEVERIKPNKIFFFWDPIFDKINIANLLCSKLF